MVGMKASRPLSLSLCHPPIFSGAVRDEILYEWQLKEQFASRIRQSTNKRNQRNNILENNSARIHQEDPELQRDSNCNKGLMFGINLGERVKSRKEGNESRGDAGMMLRNSKLQLQPSLPRHESRLLRPQNSSFDSKPQLGRTGKEEGKERGRDAGGATTAMTAARTAKKEVKLSLRTARAGPERGAAPGGRVTKQGTAEKSLPNSIIGGAAVIA